MAERCVACGKPITTVRALGAELTVGVYVPAGTDGQQ